MPKDKGGYGSHQPLKVPRVDPPLPTGPALDTKESLKGSQDAHHNGSNSR